MALATSALRADSTVSCRGATSEATVVPHEPAPNTVILTTRTYRDTRPDAGAGVLSLSLSVSAAMLDGAVLAGGAGRHDPRGQCRPRSTRTRANSSDVISATRVRTPNP